MNTHDIITWLRDKLPYAPDHAWKNVMSAAAAKLEELEEELKTEMYRHDRLQDFEVAEAEELARIKAENIAMAEELKKAGGCGTCMSCKVDYLEEPCFSCMQDPDYPGWEWNKYQNIRKEG